MLFLASIAALSCADRNATSSSAADARDPHSFSRPDEAVVRHVGLDLDVDFASRRLSGTATLTIENLTGTSELWLDSRGLDVSAADLGSDDAPADFRFGDEKPYLGQPLIIAIEPTTTTVRVHYSSRSDAAALQ